MKTIVILSFLLVSFATSAQDSTRVSPIVVHTSAQAPLEVDINRYLKQRDIGLQFSWLGAVALTTAATFSAAYFHENKKNASKPDYKVKSVDPYWFAGGFALLTVGITLDINASHKLRRH